MGYTLRIGELKTRIEYEGLESYITNDAEAVTDEKAPAFGEPTDHSNSRWPSYTSWYDAMRFVGLHDMMFNKETGLIRSHPDCVPLVKEHKEIIDKAYKEFYEKYPNCKAGYSPKINEKEGVYEDAEWPSENNYATRLEWLKYWVDWALENCQYPVFYNS
jgi:hypothetical protein